MYYRMHLRLEWHICILCNFESSMVIQYAFLSVCFCSFLNILFTLNLEYDSL